jgi:hypothetical protein
MAKRPLTLHEFFNLLNGSYPTLKFDADQWGESGYFYDPANRQFGFYAMDRKEQYDEVETVATAEELLQQHCGAERRPAVQAWLDSFRIGRFERQTLIWYPERKQLLCFPLVVSPIVVNGEQESLAALNDNYAVKWLKEQLGRRSCPVCEAYFGDWRSHGPDFPAGAFEIIEKNEIEVGTHGAVTMMEGVARCRTCAQLAIFGCEYGPGYWLSPKKTADR